MASCSLSLWSGVYTFHNSQTQLGAKCAAFHFLSLLGLRIFWSNQQCLNHHFWSTAAWQGFWWELFQECGELVVLLSLSSDLPFQSIVRSFQWGAGEKLIFLLPGKEQTQNKKRPLAWPAVLQWLNWNVDSPSNEIPLVLGMAFPLLPSLSRIGWTLPPFPQ